WVRPSSCRRRRGASPAARRTWASTTPRSSEADRGREHHRLPVAPARRCARSTVRRPRGRAGGPRPHLPRFRRVQGVRGRRWRAPGAGHLRLRRGGGRVARRHRAPRRAGRGPQRVLLGVRRRGLLGAATARLAGVGHLTRHSREDARVLFLHETHHVAGYHEDAFEHAFREGWMPTLARGDDARLLWYLNLAHGSGWSYRVVTITAVRDGAAWERLARRIQSGDLQDWMRELDT